MVADIETTMNSAEVMSHAGGIECDDAGEQNWEPILRHSGRDSPSSALTRSGSPPRRNATPPGEESGGQQEGLKNKISPEARRIIEEWVQSQNQNSPNAAKRVVLMPYLVSADAGPPTRFQRRRGSSSNSTLATNNLY